MKKQRNSVKRNCSILAVILLGLISGCGYVTEAYNLPANLKTVYVDTFSNNSDQSNIENELRIRLANAFQDEGHLKISSKNESDTVLSGKIVSYSRQAMRYYDDETIEEYRLTIAVDFEFKDSSSGKVIVKSDNFTGDTSYYITGANAKSESTARQEAIDDLAHRILNKIVTLW